MKALLPKLLFSTLILILSTFFVQAACTASFTKSISGLTVTFTNTSTSSAGMSNVHFFWSFSNGQSSTLANPVTTFLAPGMQVAQLSMYDSSTHCTSSFMDSVFVVSPTNACAANFIKSASGSTVVLTNMSTNKHGLATGLSYYWYFSDGTSSTLKDPTKIFTTNGLKTISLTITDSSQGCFATRVDSLMLPSGCAASFNTSMSGLTATFTNTSINGNGTANGLTYEWHFTHDNSTYTSKNITKTFPSVGYWPVRLSISDPSQGCLTKIHDTVYVGSSSACVASFSKSVSGFTVYLTNTSLNTNGSPAGLSYYWYFSDGTSSTLKDPAKIFASPGLKTINLTITDSTQGCFASVSDTVFIAPPLPICQASFSLAVDTSMPFHFFILNTSLIQAGSTFFWNFGDGTSSTSMTPTHTYASFGPRYVCLTVSHPLCTSTFCDTIGMDTNGMLLKQGAFGFHTLDFTTISTTTATSELTATPEYTIYPNPSNGVVFIDYTFPSAAPLTIEVRDITGKIVKSKQTNSLSGTHTETLDIADLQPAIYFMTMRSADMQKNYKLIKN